MSVAEKINSLLDKFDQRRGKIDLSLDRIKIFLNKIGNPHLQVPPVIHFAGTNGKGSTIAFLKAMIEADGKTCHVYTSPHLVRFNERIAVSGKDIEDDFLLETLQQLEKDYEAQDEVKLTFFELTTIAAFIAFSKVKADFTLLETGLGGLYDATNLIDKPLLTVITPISIDHTEFLGNTIKSIAYGKAGIIKPGVLCISAPQVADAKEVLLRIANEKGSEILFVEPQNDLPELSLKGEHQKINASTAIAVAKEIGLSEAAIQKGLFTAKWNARMQHLTNGELPSLLPNGYELWLDGAHNIAGAETLAKEIKSPAYLIMGMLNNRDAKAYLEILKNKIKAFYAIPIPGHDNCHEPEKLKLIAESLGIKAFANNNAAAAIKDILDEGQAPSSIFICGSLYLAGEILKSNS